MFIPGFYALDNDAEFGFMGVWRGGDGIAFIDLCPFVGVISSY